jgi:hypothetical protein
MADLILLVVSWMGRRFSVYPSVLSPSFCVVLLLLGVQSRGKSFQKATSIDLCCRLLMILIGYRGEVSEISKSLHMKKNVASISSQHLQLSVSNEYGDSASFQAAYPYLTDTVILVEPFKICTLLLSGSYSEREYTFKWSIDGFSNHQYGTSVDVIFSELGNFNVDIEILDAYGVSHGNYYGMFVSK